MELPGHSAQLDSCLMLHLVKIFIEDLLYTRYFSKCLGCTIKMAGKMVTNMELIF